MGGGVVCPGLTCTVSTLVDYSNETETLSVSETESLSVHTNARHG